MKNLYNISEIPNPRMSLHFCLGSTADKEFFSDSGKNAVENEAKNPRKYAVVTRLENLMPQLANIYMSDTYILGEYFLGKNDMLIIPYGNDITSTELAQTGVQIIHYAPNTSTLSEVVERVITDMNGWHTKFYDDWDRATIDGIQESNVNTKDFFAPIFSKYPSVTFGTHQYLLSRLEMINQTIAYFLVGEADGCDHTIPFLLDYYAHITHMQDFRRWLDASHVEPSTKEYCIKRISEQSKCINLILLEILLRSIGYTLEGRLHNNNLLREGILAKLEDLNELVAYVNDNISSLGKYTRSFNDELNIKEMAMICSTVRELSSKEEHKIPGNLDEFEFYIDDKTHGFINRVETMLFSKKLKDTTVDECDELPNNNKTLKAKL